jgi:8-oxo-dGTP pyrophosphatase MutT (NUDIX family)
VPAAVLVLFRPEARSPDRLDLVLTRRSLDLPTHSGQVAFAGGTCEPADRDVVDTALREAREELGVPGDAILTIGRLDDLDTTTGYHVSPVVGQLTRPVSLVPDATEVARVFFVPLDLLLDDALWHQKIHRYGGEDVSLWHFDYDGEDIWGVTATILRGLIQLLRKPA